MSIIFPNFSTAYFLPDDEEYFRKLTETRLSRTCLAKEHPITVKPKPKKGCEEAEVPKQQTHGDDDSDDLYYPRYRPSKSGNPQEDVITMNFRVRDDLIKTCSGTIYVDNLGVTESERNLGKSSNLKERSGTSVTVFKIPSWCDEDGVEQNIYDMHFTQSEMDLPTKVDEAEDEPKMVSKATSFEDIEKLMELAEKAAVSDGALRSELSFGLVRNAGMHNIPSATGLSFEEDLAVPQKESTSRHGSYDGHRDWTPRPPRKFISVFVRADFAPRDFQGMMFQPMEPELETKWFCVNGGMTRGADCIVVEPWNIAVKIEQWINWSTLLYSVFGSYLSLSIMVVGLTKFDDHRMGIFGLANVWLFKKYREYIESDATCHYRNINFSLPADMKIVMKVFEPMPSRAKLGKVFMRDSRIILKRRVILHSLLITQLVCTMYKVFFS